MSSRRSPEEIAEMIRAFSDGVTDAENWIVSVPVDRFDAVESLLDTEHENLGTIYNGLSLCYTQNHDETRIRYATSLENWNERAHEYDFGTVLEKFDSSRWRITNRLIDVDTDETLYRVCETDSNRNVAESEIVTESLIDRSFERVDEQEIRTDGGTDARQVEWEKNKSFELGHISQLEDVAAELRERSGEIYAQADRRREIQKAEQLKELAREFEERAENRREQWEEKFKNQPPETKTDADAGGEGQ